MGCRGCGGRTATPAAARATSAPPLALLDEQFQMVQYNHPSRGQQTTIGQAVFGQKIEGVHMVRDRNNTGWRIHYGWRGGGEKFLAHVEDIRLASHLYTPIETRPAAPPIEKRAPAPPTSLTEPEGVMMEGDVGMPTPAPKRIDLEKVMAGESEPRRPEVDDELAPFDWQRLPGVTAKVAEKLEGMDLEDVVEMGVEGLQGIQYVGPTRAKSIYAAAIEALSGA